MIDWVLRSIAKLLLSLRYRIRIRGLDEVAARGTRGILFLPNHPALVDPIILVTHLRHPFRPRPLADEAQINYWPVNWVARYVGIRGMKDVSTHGAGAGRQIRQVINECRTGLAGGENILLYPSGHLYRSRLENLRGNSAAEELVRESPRLRVVLVRTRGLWGSVFSMAQGEFPTVFGGFRRGAWALLKSLVFFAPRREVTIDLVEPADLPRGAGRGAFNQYLENFYNEEAPPNTYVPYSPWKGRRPLQLPDPVHTAAASDAGDVPESTRQIVLDHLKQQLGAAELRDQDRLGPDLGMDSLAKAELLVWLGQEFGQHVSDVTALNTVGDVLLAACGEVVERRASQLKPPPRSWFRSEPGGRLFLPAARTITQAFLQQARLNPGRVIVADQVTGALTYQTMLVAILALKPKIEKLEGERVGIMLPASVGACVAYMAALFAGKTPVMVNWTTGARNVRHSLDVLDVRSVLTARPLVARIEGQGADLTPVKSRFVYLEDVRRQIGGAARLSAAFQGYLDWASLEQARPSETAAILLTSGSEALPKAVPLTHANILANLRDVLLQYTMLDSDRLLGFLPPFILSAWP
jgi:long-chain-fatty-acid--[acyl-carrier-protein] ligase